MIMKGSEDPELASVYTHAKMFPKAHVHRTAGAGTPLGTELASEPVQQFITSGSHVSSLFIRLLSEMGTVISSLPGALGVQ